MARNSKTQSFPAGQVIERRGLEVAPLFVFLLALLITLGVYAALIPIQDSYVGVLLYERGFTQYIVVYFAAVVIAFSLLKYWRLRSEFRALRRHWLPSNIDLDNPTSSKVLHLQQSLINLNSLIATRASRVLAAYIHFGDRQAATEFALEDSSFDSSASDSSYALPRILVWAIPLIGFIGTVIGISSAVRGFSGFLDQAGDVEQIREGIGTVTGGLAVAFDTTLLALLLSVFVMIPLVLIERMESRLLLGIDIYLNDQLLPRLRGTSQNLNPQVIDRAVQQALQKHFPSSEVLIQPAQEYAKQAAAALAESFVSEISKVQEVNQQLIQQMGKLGQIANQDRQNFLQAYEQQQQNSQGIIQEIRSTVAEIQQGHRLVANSLTGHTQQIAQQLEQAAKALENRINSLEECTQRVTELAQLQQSLDQTISSLEQTAQLEHVLVGVRDHLAQLQPVLQQLNKPRRITLVEQDNGSL